MLIAKAKLKTTARTMVLRFPQIRASSACEVETGVSTRSLGLQVVCSGELAIEKYVHTDDRTDFTLEDMIRVGHRLSRTTL
jgi:hypothetical protein